MIDFEEYQSIKALLSEPEKLADYLDYLHMQTVKQTSSKRHTLAEVKQACGILQALQGITLEQMDEAIKERGGSL
ncbi:hypothetical protein [Methylobacter psychrophilus]|uniref:hypothetical protein n=1 Tax=Methylobacter psychrophilus TaxID=96941 RepID=UPI0021D512A1|nr:hypothetical protein [Methylobacter psychrophilus]